MVAETRSLEVVVTHTEVEALLLENNLIKRLMPRYNVLLRDDKSFPYIHLTGDHAFPQIIKHRGARSAPGDYFGPFASAGAVARTIIALQRAFLLRSCSDSIFASRTRPCLLYQITRRAASSPGAARRFRSVWRCACRSFRTSSTSRAPPSSATASAHLRRCRAGRTSRWTALPMPT
jgi:excinuclease UvrABC nuclease subunit